MDSRKRKASSLPPEITKLNRFKRAQILRRKRSGTFTNTETEDKKKQYSSINSNFTFQSDHTLKLIEACTQKTEDSITSRRGNSMLV